MLQQQAVFPGFSWHLTPRASCDWVSFILKNMPFSIFSSVRVTRDGILKKMTTSGGVHHDNFSHHQPFVDTPRWKSIIYRLWCLSHGKTIPNDSPEMGGMSHHTEPFWMFVIWLLIWFTTSFMIL